jgi:thiamine biosynthesis lipoprotein
MTTGSDEYISREFPALGTINGIYIYGSGRAETLDEAQQRVTFLESRLSVFREGSDIWRLNRAAGKKPVEVSGETLALLKAAKEYGRLSSGAFAATIRPLTALWNVTRPGAEVPDAEAIDDTKELVRDDDLMLDEASSTAFLKRPGQSVDLGGIAKGYIADEVKKIIDKNGVRSAIIDLGGNIVAVGTRPDGGPWQIGIQNPADVRGSYIGSVCVSDETVVTSGVNERFFMKDGVCYHHIIDPRSGYPASSGLLSVTIVERSSMDADALTTAVFVLGIEKGAELLKSQHADAVFTTNEHKIFVTEGMKDRFVIKAEKQNVNGGI